MSNTHSNVYELTSKGLKPIVADDIVIGQRVIQAHRYEQGVVCELASQHRIGVTVIYPDGSESSSQRLESLSPYTRISLVNGVASSAEVAALLQKRIEKREQDRIDREAAANQHQLETERIVKELRAKYPWVKTNNASKNLKKELTLAFPKVKFSVRNSHGTSLDISWTDGPTRSQVEKIANKYQEGNFDGMTDSYNYDQSAYGAAMDIVLGREQYVFANRSFSNSNLFETVCRDIAKLQGVEVTSTWQRRDGDSLGLDDYAHRVLANTAFPVGAEYIGVACSFKIELTGACLNGEQYRIIHSMTDEEAEMREVIKAEFDYLAAACLTPLLLNKEGEHHANQLCARSCRCY